MQSADDVQFRDAELQRLARFPDDFLDGKLEAVGVAFLARERAELAREDAVVRVVDVAVDDVAGAVADFALPHEIGDGTEGVQVLRFKQPHRIGFGNAFARDDFVVDVAEFAALNEKIHIKGLPKSGRLANLRLRTNPRQTAIRVCKSSELLELFAAPTVKSEQKWLLARSNISLRRSRKRLRRSLRTGARLGERRRTPVPPSRC